ncbi:MAG: hypothetical protein K2X68_07580, partial [Novosphingobium sp.]|nr:hypothetical protein [Novosphingobium sp.]
MNKAASPQRDSSAISERPLLPFSLLRASASPREPSFFQDNRPLKPPRMTDTLTTILKTKREEVAARKAA